VSKINGAPLENQWRNSWRTNLKIQWRKPRSKVPGFIGFSFAPLAFFNGAPMAQAGLRH
jgi:hypothetical protein